MSCSNIFLFSLIISIGHLMRHTLSAEGVMHGIIVNTTDFAYQAAFFGSPARHAMSTLLCSGVVLSAVWILSIARCFMLNNERLKPLIFTVVVGSEDITERVGPFAYVNYIYTILYNAYYVKGLVMVRVGQGLPLGTRTGTPIPLWTKVGIPERGERFAGRTGRVSGYGRHKFGNEDDQDGPDTDYNLRYTNVVYSRERHCVHDFPYIYSFDKFCGVAANVKGRYTGMCLNDLGNPLVIDDKVVGLSISSHVDCNDTNNGSLYIEVEPYFNFIYNILRGMPLLTYRRHIPRIHNYLLYQDNK